MPAMPANEVTAYLEASGLEKELADCVNQVVREKAPDALARLSELLAAKVRHHARRTCLPRRPCRPRRLRRPRRPHLPHLPRPLLPAYPDPNPNPYLTLTLLRAASPLARRCATTLTRWVTRRW